MPHESPARELLTRKMSGPGPHALRALDHLAFAILLEGGADVEQSLAALASLREFFVDWNETRVARTQELARQLGDIPENERAAMRIKEEYNAFFEKKGSLSFEFLAAGKPAETRRALNQMLPHLPKGAASLLLYEFCPGATMPLSDEAVKQARKDGIVAKSADRGQISRLLADEVSPAEAAMLLQYWEMEAWGHPYGESGQKDLAAGVKKGKKPAGKAKTK